MTTSAQHHPANPLPAANRRGWTHRTLACLAAAVVMAAALWAARVEITTAWFQRSHSKPQEASAPAATIRQVAKEEEAPRELPGTDSSTSPVPLPLILTATFPGRNAAEGRALIGANFTNPQMFAAGALLSNGARLVEIHRDRVILERAGKRAALMLSLSKEAAMAALDQRASGALELATAGGTQPPRANQPSSANPLTDVLVPSPVYDANGLLAGFEVYAGRDRAAFGRLGLQSGDVIESIDGVPLNDLQSAAEAFRMLGDGYVVSARILRKRDRLHVSLDGATLSDTRDPGGTSMASAEAIVPST